MTITINGSGTITGASTLATTVASPTFTTPNINSAQFATVSGTAPLYACRAWVYFTVTAGTPAIQASGNITSITDNGAGDYTFNFTTSMPDANFSFTGLGTAGGANYQIAGGGQSGGTVRAVGSLRTPFGFVSSITGALTAQDPASASIHIFR
jgi:hypothetical protein